MHPAILFQGSSLDIYVHWLILALGAGIFLSAISILVTCRTVAGYFHLLGNDNSLKTRIYKAYFKYHPFYWWALGVFLVLHLMVTLYHIGLPFAGNPYLLAQQVSFYTSITNVVFALIVFTSCRTFLSIVTYFTSKSPLSERVFKRFYSFHSIFWWFLSISVATHIVAGLIHAVNT